APAAHAGNRHSGSDPLSGLRCRTPSSSTAWVSTSGRIRAPAAAERTIDSDLAPAASSARRKAVARGRRCLLFALPQRWRNYPASKPATLALALVTLRDMQDKCHALSCHVALTWGVKPSYSAVQLPDPADAWQPPAHWTVAEFPLPSSQTALLPLPPE